MDFQQLKYFKAVATIGKIADAAESLFISAPALSTSISRLEKELGIRLFDRAGNRITLNAQGKIFLQHVNHILSDMEAANQEMHQSLAQINPSISFVSTNSLIWVNLITAFTSEFPQYTMACANCSLKNNGLPAHQHLLTAYENEIPLPLKEELNIIPLFQSHPVVMIHKDHPLAQQSEIDVTQLVNEKLFMSQPDEMLHTRLTQLFNLHGLPLPNDTYYSYLLRQEMVSKNLGISFASHAVSHVSSPSIRYIPLVDPFEPWIACLCWRKDTSLTEHEELFKQFAESFFNRLH